MAKDEFTPKLGRIRSTSAARPRRYLGRVVRAISRNSPGSSGTSSWTGSRNGRGYASGVGMRASRPRRRRVIVKARIMRFRNADLGAARAHLKYIRRDGVTREGEHGDLYGPESDHIDARAFLDPAREDRHQFRLIVAPEDGAQLGELKPFIRDLMGQAETDLGTKLDWVAVDHFNTGHPHTHIVIRGRDDRGGDLVIARDYMAHGFRTRASELVTLELGPETVDELHRKLAREVEAERFTRIDRALLRDADSGILSIGSSQARDDGQFRALRMGRLRKLERMGLAGELKPGLWQIAERTEIVLRELGRRSDIIKTMQRCLKEAGIEHDARPFNIFKADDPSSRMTGKVISLGLSNEMTGAQFAVVDGIDGKMHYAEVSQLDASDPPREGLLVTLQGQIAGVESSRRNHARLFVESHAPLEQLPTTVGATWLDRQLLASQPSILSDQGFGVEVQRALRQRQRWLIDNGYASERGGQLVARRRLLETLTRNDVALAGSLLAKKLGRTFRDGSEFDLKNTKTSGSIRLASGRFAIVEKGKEFTLLPWRQMMNLRKVKGLGIQFVDGFSR